MTKDNGAVVGCSASATKCNPKYSCNNLNLYGISFLIYNWIGLSVGKGTARRWPNKNGPALPTPNPLDK